jgi:hypothetical protein
MIKIASSNSLMRQILFISTVFCALLLSSCGGLFDKAVTPHFIYFNSAQLVTNASTQGAPSHNISELWVVVEGKWIGTFDIKKPIPIISDKSNVIVTVFPGIRANGSRQDARQYFLMQDINIELQFKEGTIDTIDAVFKYSDNTNFAFAEGFESGNIFTNILDSDPETSITVTQENPRSGGNCGKARLDKNHKRIVVTSSGDFFELPTRGNMIFLEIDYRTNTELIIGLIGKDLISGVEFSTELIYLKTQENWNKLYLDLTQSVRESGYSNFKIFFKAEHNEENDTSEVFLDDIKLLYLRI